MDGWKKIEERLLAKGDSQSQEVFETRNERKGKEGGKNGWDERDHTLQTRERPGPGEALMP